jgi:hypothetical protein
MWRWLSSLIKDRTKPSEYIRRHLDGTGSGFELDDLTSWHDRDPAWQDVIDRLMEINRRHGSPLGVYKDEARQELLQLAVELEAQGR